MAYKNIITWEDYEENVIRNKGEIYTPTNEKRTASLLTPNNKAKRPLIVWVDEVAEDLTVEELKSKLDEMGVEYKSSDKKADLIAKLQAEE